MDMETDITISFLAARETLLALNDRRQMLIAEQRKTRSDVIRRISEDQQSRVEDAMRVLQKAVGEVWI